MFGVSIGVCFAGTATNGGTNGGTKCEMGR